MFKKLIAILLLLSVISIPVLAEQTANRMNAFEYTELFISRADTLKYEGKINLDLPSTGVSYDVFNLVEGSYDVETSSAMIQIDDKDLSVIGLTATLMMMKSGEVVDRNNSIIAMLAFSALEFDALDDTTIQLKYRLGLSDYSNAIMKAFGIFEEQISPIQTKNMSAIMNGEKIVVYEGKYTWSIDYMASDNYQIFFLTAE